MFFATHFALGEPLVTLADHVGNLEQMDGDMASVTEEDQADESTSEDDQPAKLRLFSGAEPSTDFTPATRKKKKKAKKDGNKLALIRQEQVTENFWRKRLICS